MTGTDSVVNISVTVPQRAPQATFLPNLRSASLRDLDPPRAGLLAEPLDPPLGGRVGVLRLAARGASR